MGVDASGVDAEASASERTRPGAGSQPPNAAGTEGGTTRIARLTEVPELFHEAMSSLASGVAVVTARRPDGHPCGLAVTSVTSYSAHPPSLLVSIAHVSRCHEALAGCERFG